MRRGLEGPGVPAVPEYHCSETGWALAIPISGSWVHTGWVLGGTRYSTHPVPTGRTHLYQGPVHQPAATGTQGHAHMTVLRSTKEILGVDNAHQHVRARPGPHMLCLALPATLRMCSWALPVRLLESKPVISQLYLVISQI